MRSFLLRFLFLLALAPALPAATVTTSVSFFPNAAVPDNDPLGLLDRRTVVSAIHSIETIRVTVMSTGGWNGDLFAYLAHESGYTVLLNRVGRTAGNPDGFGSIGMFINFTDDASGGDIHTNLLDADGTFATGDYAPDGRTASPLLVTDLSPRLALLSSFHGLPASGEWELFVADLSPGTTSQLVSWELELTGQPIPEPSSFILLGVGSVLMWRRRR